MQTPMPEGISVAGYKSERLPTSYGEHNLHEGDIISTIGYIHLSAFEKPKDGDYHLQMTSSSSSGDNCFIVEIPAPEFIADPKTREQVTIARQFVRDRLCGGLEPTLNGRVMQHDVYVRVTGQLFADLHHLKTYDQLGKRGMKSGTVWEIHPVTKIEFVAKEN